MFPGLAARPLLKGREQIVLETARFGQCRLIKSGANIVLQPYQGNLITIAGAAVKIPAGGVSLPPAGLTPGTVYLIYACMGAGGLTLEASTVGHATDITTGVEIKQADFTRTLVGMVRPIAGPAFQDATNQRFVISWFNQRPIPLQAVLAANAGNFSTGVYTILSASLLLEFLTWSANAVASRFQGTLSNNVINTVSQTASFLDGANSESVTVTQAYAVNAAQPVYCSLDTLASEGYHFFNVYAQQNAVSTATYSGGSTPGLRCVHSGVIQG